MKNVFLKLSYWDRLKIYLSAPFTFAFITYHAKGRGFNRTVEILYFFAICRLTINHSLAIAKLEMAKNDRPTTNQRNRP